ncbi:MAG: adenylosuccinate lyase, partial [Gemmatimonadales bacterium]|nr:adenylosuccinate lyase [Gemmatimonadales bacterium]
EPNDLLDRLAGAPEFSRVPVETLRAELDPARYVGRAPEQVGEFLAEFLEPLLERARAVMQVAPPSELRV